jgi:hypothetical protein
VLQVIAMRERHNVWVKVALVASIAAAALHAYTALVNADGGPSLFGAGLWVWSIVPYAVGLLIATRWNAITGALIVLAALTVDVFIYYSVFVEPDSSTAALGLLAAPAFNLLIVLPVCLLLGFVISRATRPRPA